jgi:hypothetical protein
VKAAPDKALEVGAGRGVETPMRSPSADFEFLANRKQKTYSICDMGSVNCDKLLSRWGLH